jgi:hypothetical protein
MALSDLPAKVLAERLEVAEKEVIELRIKNKILVDRMSEIVKVEKERNSAKVAKKSV